MFLEFFPRKICRHDDNRRHDDNFDIFGVFVDFSLQLAFGHNGV